MAFNYNSTTSSWDYTYEAFETELYGESLDISSDGDTVVFGAPGKPYTIDVCTDYWGEVHIATRSMGNYGTSQILTFPDSYVIANCAYFADPGRDPRFGQSVSLSKDASILAVGAPGLNTGSVFMYNTVGPGQYAFLQELTASSDADDFGIVVKVDRSNGQIAVGCPFDNGKGANAGAVYIFSPRVDGPFYSDWVQTCKVTSSMAAAGDYFGDSLQISSSFLVASSPYEAPGGFAYSFLSSSGTGWSEIQRFGGSGDPLAEFGLGETTFGRAYPIGMENNKLVIGNVDENVGNYDGVVYFYTLNLANNLWVSAGTATTPVASHVTALQDAFGISVFVTGSMIAIAAPDVDGGTHLDNGSGHRGVVYLYYYKDAAFNYLGFIDPMLNGFWGKAVALYPPTAQAGAEDILNKSDITGSCVVSGYLYTVDNWAPALVDDGNMANDYYAGRVNFYDYKWSPLNSVCGVPIISSNFTLQHYICLPTNYNDVAGDNPLSVPFSTIFRPFRFVSGSNIAKS